MSRVSKHHRAPTFRLWPPFAFRPALEQLEDRRLLSVVCYPDCHPAESASNDLISIQDLERGSGPLLTDTTAPTFSNPLLGGNSPASSFQVTQGQALNFAGAVSDNVALSVITVNVSSPRATNYTVTTGSVSGASKSLSTYSIDTGNSTYAGVTGNYTVTLFAKDSSNNLSSRTWNFTVVALPTFQQFKQLDETAINGIGNDVEIVIANAVLNASVQILLGETIETLRPVGTFINTAGEAAWHISVDLGQAGLTFANYVTVISERAVSIVDTIIHYVTATVIEDVETIQAVGEYVNTFTRDSYENVAKKLFQNLC